MEEPVSQTLWVGIDEAGYGPNLGPLVMTAVVAVGTGSAPNLWHDLPGIFRAKQSSGQGLCVDDSKEVMARRDGRELLERACRSIVATSLDGFPTPFSKNHWLETFGADIYGGEELARWSDGVLPSPPVDLAGVSVPLACDGWRILAMQVKVVGPEKFNRLLEKHGNKAAAHSSIFIELLEWVKTLAGPDETVQICSDKHGGRHFYMPMLAEAFPDLWIQNLQEKPALSHYKIKADATNYEFRFLPKADSENGLVALASMVSKLMREQWMDRFNAWFARRLPGLKPTAGYPMDAKRFSREIAALSEVKSLPADLWWRRK